MKRTQIIMDDWGYEELKAYAERHKVSMSEVMRDAVAVYMAGKKRPRKKSALREIRGIVCDGANVARDHDHYLYGSPKKKRRS